MKQTRPHCQEPHWNSKEQECKKCLAGYELDHSALYTACRHFGSEYPDIAVLWECACGHENLFLIGNPFGDLLTHKEDPITPIEARTKKLADMIIGRWRRTSLENFALRSK